MSASASGTCEDDDWCLRAEAAGFGSVVARDVFVHHRGGRTFTAERIDLASALARNVRRFEEKWGCSREAWTGEGAAAVAPQLLATNMQLPLPERPAQPSGWRRVPLWRRGAARALPRRGALPRARRRHRRADAGLSRAGELAGAAARPSGRPPPLPARARHRPDASGRRLDRPLRRRRERARGRARAHPRRAGAPERGRCLPARADPSRGGGRAVRVCRHARSDPAGGRDEPRAGRARCRPRRAAPRPSRRRRLRRPARRGRRQRASARAPDALALHGRQGRGGAAALLPRLRPRRRRGDRRRRHRFP